MRKRAGSMGNGRTSRDLRRLRDRALATRLGRCRVCMTLSLLAAVASWTGVYALTLGVPAGPLIALAGAVALVSTELLLAHAVMVVVRARLPAPAPAVQAVSAPQRPTAQRGCGCGRQPRAA